LKKHQTYDQLEATKQKAVRFARDVLQDDDKADDLDSESLESYAQRKGIQITDNPERRRRAVANGSSSLTKSDLADIVDQVTQLLEDVYTPESSREELATAIGTALDILEGDGEDDADLDDDFDDDSDDGGSE
jgi:hypothetical protein